MLGTKFFADARYYKRAYGEFFLTSDSSGKHLAVADNMGCMADYYRFGWLLFLALRVHVFSRFKDLVTSTNGLVAILVSFISLVYFFKDSWFYLLVPLIC